MNRMRRYLTVSAGLLLACIGAQAQNPFTTWANPYDTEDSIASWSQWNGNVNETIAWDKTVDAAGNASSGAAKFSAEYTGAPAEFFDAAGTFANRWPFDFDVILDATYYSSLQFDILVSTNSSLSKASKGANFGTFDINLLCTVNDEPWIPVKIGSVAVPASATNRWFHVSLPIDPSLAGLSFCYGYDIQQTSDADHAGPMTFWIDNLTLDATVPAVPPTLSISPKLSAIGLYTATVTGTDSETTFQGIKSPTMTWVGRQDTVTYSVTIGDYPTNSGFVTDLLVSGTNSEAAFSISDLPNLISVRIASGPNAAASAQVLLQTNAVAGGTLATLASSQVLGTWSLSFTKDTNATLTAPDGAKVDFVLPTDAIPYFADYDTTFAIFGTQPNTPGNVGLGALITQAKIAAGEAVFADAKLYSGALDTGWSPFADDPSAMAVMPIDSVLWLSWNDSASAFTLQATTDPGDALSWKTVESLTVLDLKSHARAIVTQSFMDANGFQTNCVFRVKAK